MFEKNQLIMCGGHGVCRVVNVTGNPIDRFDKTRKFYVLEPVLKKQALFICLWIMTKSSCAGL